MRRIKFLVFTSKLANKNVRKACMMYLYVNSDNSLLHKVYPYKNKVTRALADNLDDKKRLVRAEAVKCRTEW